MIRHATSAIGPRPLGLMSTVLLAATLSACATPPAPSAGEPAPPRPGVCNAEAARAAIGREPTAEIIERARIDSGSATVRVIQPDMAVTMDYREDRLNIDVNARGAITGLRCG